MNNIEDKMCTISFNDSHMEIRSPKGERIDHVRQDIQYVEDWEGGGIHTVRVTLLVKVKQ